MSKSGEFKTPEVVESVGAAKFIKGPHGEPLGPGYLGYELLIGDDVQGNRWAVLVGTLGATAYILHESTFRPLRFGRGGIKGTGFFRFEVADGRLIGRSAGSEPTEIDLGAWPPRQAYICEPDPGIDNDDL